MSEDVPNTGAGIPFSQAPNWPSSPYHGAINGDGQAIPCRCRFQGHQYRLGETVCMSTHVGTVLTRCDLFVNNTSWIPTSEPCALSQRPQPERLAGH